MSLGKRVTAELIGTFWLVFAGCGSAVIAGAFPQTGIGLLGISFAFGLALLTMMYAVGHVSGCHLNPAVSLGFAVSGRFPVAEVPAYVIAQVLGATAGAGLLYFIASGSPAFTLDKGLATNGYGAHSPGGYTMAAAFTLELILTFMFLMILLSAIDRAPAGLAPIPIGLGLVLVHLIGLPVTNVSVNPARSAGPAIIVGNEALQQLWLFWVAPLAGALVAGVTYPALAATSERGGQSTVAIRGSTAHGKS